MQIHDAANWVSLISRAFRRLQGWRLWLVRCAIFARCWLVDGQMWLVLTFENCSDSLACEYSRLSGTTPVSLWAGSQPHSQGERHWERGWPGAMRGGCVHTLFTVLLALKEFFQFLIHSIGEGLVQKVAGLCLPSLTTRTHFLFDNAQSNLRKKTER